MRAHAKRPEFDAFVANRWPRLLRVAYLLTGDWAGAEDLLQTALVKAWFAWRRIGGDPEPYVRRIVVTTFVSHRRRRWHGEVPVGTVPDVMGADASAGHADRDLLWRALLRLPAKQRAVLVLRYFEDLSEDQIATTLGVRTGTVKSQASKALARLRLDESLREPRVDNTGETMMDTDDLAQLLAERSAHDRLPPGPALHDRIARGRRRRAAGTAAVAVALVLVVTVPVLLTRGGEAGDPVGGPPAASGRPTNEAERVPAAYTGGYRLADSRTSVLPAGNTFTYTFTPETYDFKLMLWCDSAWGSRLRAFIADKQVETDYCEPAGKRGEFFPGTRSRPAAEKQKFWEDHFGVRVGTPVTVTVRVHTGPDDRPDPEPPTAAGVARLLVYEAVPFAEYPFPDPPRSIPRITGDPAMPGEPVINYRDAFELSTTQNVPINGYYPFSVTRQSGRDIQLSLDARGPGVLRIVVDQRVEVFMMEYWEWQNAGWSITIDPGLLPAGRSVAVGIYAEHFTAPVWRVTATDVPEQPRGG